MWRNLLNDQSLSRGRFNFAKLSYRISAQDMRPTTKIQGHGVKGQYHGMT